MFPNSIGSPKTCLNWPRYRAHSCLLLHAFPTFAILFSSKSCLRCSAILFLRADFFIFRGFSKKEAFPRALLQRPLDDSAVLSSPGRVESGLSMQPTAERSHSIHSMSSRSQSFPPRSHSRSYVEPLPRVPEMTVPRDHLSILPTKKNSHKIWNRHVT